MEDHAAIKSDVKTKLIGNYLYSNYEMKRKKAP